MHGIAQNGLSMAQPLQMPLNDRSVTCHLKPGCSDLVLQAVQLVQTPLQHL